MKNNTHDANTRKVTIAGRVEPGVAEAVRALADRGDRTVSREVATAIREHVARAEQVYPESGGFSSSSHRPSLERGEPSGSVRQLSSPPLAGDEER
jgi:hypothetical protein